MPLSSLFFYISLGFTTVEIENMLRYASENQFKIVVETMEKAKLPNFFHGIVVCSAIFRLDVWQS